MSLPVYVICCDELPRRKAAALAHLAERGVPATPWRSYHGATWGLETAREYDPGKRISPGHVGLILGHYSLWQHLSHSLRGPDDAAVVLEDDAVLPPDFWGRLSGLRMELLRHFADWQFAFLGLADAQTPGLWNKVTERVGPPDGTLCRVHWPFGTHAYMVRKSALPALLDAGAVAERNVDQQLYGRVLQPGLVRWCATLPSIVTQRTASGAAGGGPEWAPSTVTGYDGHAAPAPESPAPAAPPHGQTPEVVARSLLLVEPFPCLFRGEGLEIVRHHRRAVPTWECAKFAGACHQREGAAVPGVRACGPCPERLALKAVPNRPRLPLPDGHFNPSLAEFGGRLVLATRDSWGHSKVGLWELTNAAADWSGEWHCRAISSVGSPDPRAPRLEDPRLFVAPHPDTGAPALHASFSMPDGYPPKLVRVGYVRFSPDLQRVENTRVFESPHDNAYEKNWVPFWATGRLNWVYQSKPDHVVIEGGRPDTWEMVSTPNPLPWTGGAHRGGAAPVLHNGVYYHFFHGCLKRLAGNVYSMGCLTFEAEPPYRVLKQTPVPLVWPDLAMPDELVTKRMVVFPGGAVPHAGHWHVAAGIDDTYCRIYRLPFEAVDAALSDVPGDDPPASIRHTAIALGQKLPGGE